MFGWLRKNTKDSKKSDEDSENKKIIDRGHYLYRVARNVNNQYVIQQARYPLFMWCDLLKNRFESKQDAELCLKELLDTDDPLSFEW